MRFASHIRILMQLHIPVCPHMLMTCIVFGIDNFNGQLILYLFHVMLGILLSEMKSLSYK